MFQEFYGDRDTVLATMTVEEMFACVKDAAGIHFSTFRDPNKDGKDAQASDDDAEAVVAGARTVRSNHRPTAQWKAKHFAPADPDADRNIKILEYR